MPNTSMTELLTPRLLVESVMRIAPNSTMLQDIFGFGLGSPTRRVSPTRTWDIEVWDNTQAPATGTTPGGARPKINPQSAGVYTVTAPRNSESIPVLAEAVDAFRSPGGYNTNAAAGYVKGQLRFLAGRLRNLIELQTAGILRGKYYVSNAGQVLYASLSPLPGMQNRAVDFNLPAANSGNLTGILAAKWSNAATDIPAQVREISTKMVEDMGRELGHVVCPSDVWAMVLANTEVRAQSGSANTPILRSGKEGDGKTSWYELACCPGIIWHVAKHRIAVGPTQAPEALMPAKHASFFPSNDGWAEYFDAPGQLVKTQGGQPEKVYGLAMVAKPCDDPAGWEIVSEYNGIAVTNVPSAVNYGTVDW